MTVSLFQSKVPENAGVYTLLNHPLCIFVLMGIILGITYLVAMLHNKGKSYMAQIAEQLNYGNRLFSFFGWMGTVRSLALDVRIYRQDLICEKYNLKKDNPFGSKGILAKYLKGPSGCYLAVSKVEYQEEKVTDALKKAGFDSKHTEKVVDLETYLYTDYNKDRVNVSGGEAQKIAIARAIYKDAPFMILDEPTAALDPVAEAENYSKFNEIAGNRTAIYISHRLSSSLAIFLSFRYTGKRVKRRCKP